MSCIPFDSQPKLYAAVLTNCRRWALAHGEHLEPPIPRLDSIISGTQHGLYLTVAQLCCSLLEVGSQVCSCTPPDSSCMHITEALCSFFAHLVSGRVLPGEFVWSAGVDRKSQSRRWCACLALLSTAPCTGVVCVVQEVWFSTSRLLCWVRGIADGPSPCLHRCLR